MRIGHSDSLSCSTAQDSCPRPHAAQRNGSSAQVEEAIRCLGQYLGLKSTRPDKEYGTGPDVLWMSEEGHAACIEVKTDKQSTSSYRKEDVGSYTITFNG